MNIHKFPIHDFKEFLIFAKRSTYISGEQSIPPKSIASKNFLVEKNDFRYEDQYFGNLTDIGQETVWFKNTPIWGMVYRGGIFPDFIDLHQETFLFLKQALKNIPSDLPIRGKSFYTENNFEYFNYPEGDIFNFTGKELIFFKGKQICFRNYVGGTIFGK